jgi:hypothetical protein
MGLSSHQNTMMLRSSQGEKGSFLGRELNIRNYTITGTSVAYKAGTNESFVKSFDKASDNLSYLQAS